MKKLKKYINFEFIRIFLYSTTLILITFVTIFKIYIPCFLYDNYGITCPSCGITRATQNILHLHITDAIKHNAFYTLILVPFVTMLFSNDIFIIFKRRLTKIDDISYVEIILGYGRHK